MSGGSLNYIYCKDFGELFYQIDNLEKAEAMLIKRGDKDIAKDVRRLIEYLQTAENRISVLHENLAPVLKAVEWYDSGDWGENKVQKAVDEYRGEKPEENKIPETRCCGNCDKTSIVCYTSLPPQVKCTVTGKFHFYSDICDVKE